MSHAARPAGVLAAALALGGCLLAGAGAGASSGGPAARSAKCSKAKTTVIDDVGFSPPVLCLKKGTKITWKAARTNVDTHDVSVARAASSPGVPYFKSGEMVAGDSFSRKLDKKGTYLFVCTYHQQMTQKVTVR